jgi:hypothetical protein
MFFRLVHVFWENAVGAVSKRVASASNNRFMVFLAGVVFRDRPFVSLQTRSDALMQDCRTDAFLLLAETEVALRIKMFSFRWPPLVSSN